MTEKVAIVGAGTAGLLSARRLAKLGIESVVYDQKTKPGYPIRASGILSINGLKSLGIDYEKITTTMLSGAKIHTGNQTMIIKAKKPIAYVLNRLKLNELLYQECEELGVEIKTSSKVDAKLLDSLRGKGVIVGADGAISTVANHFGFPPIERYVLTYRVEYQAKQIQEPDMVELFFDKEFASGFFGWIAPESDTTVELGIGIDSKHGNSKAAFDKFLKSKAVLEKLEGLKILEGGASVIPVGLRKKFTDNLKEVVLVGDSAGQVKPTTGGGIIFGGNAALIAAQTIKAHMEKGENLENYEKIWRKEFDKEMFLHSQFYNVYTSVGKNNLERITKTLKFLGIDKFLGEYGDMDRPSVIFKRFFLRGLAK